MSRILALDVGDERTGVAISDELGLLARPLEVILRRPGPGGFIRIAEIVREQEISAIVIGLPLLADGSEGKQAASSRAFARGLERYVTAPLVWRDETDTSRRALEILAAEGRTARRQAQLVDEVAAAVLLQGYLDEQTEHRQ